MNFAQLDLAQFLVYLDANHCIWHGDNRGGTWSPFLFTRQLRDSNRPPYTLPHFCVCGQSLLISSVSLFVAHVANALPELEKLQYPGTLD